MAVPCAEVTREASSMADLGADKWLVVGRRGELDPDWQYTFRGHEIIAFRTARDAGAIISAHQRRGSMVVLLARLTRGKR